ncbi:MULTISPECIES: histidine phosphatase family protein [unclassified Modicisalibacter]|uniref:histidine phosphatase family protein n=1 Tax=unclassified Modicisalibacter TaxID=2679913 RepID=UPI001CC9244F|nr:MULTISPECIES: histidine phosphatase family protein [unclassified Modicisalibacter]MBZ9558580.1 histidine phosphatase family protein [Modicisalibacter sp. R2A 31.J]MBZ9575528.1 histidine phosphatase family protein [Modicisalibacter sp. MOD 31.J]
MNALIRRPFVFLRHGQSVSNAAREMAGSRDVALTARGEAEARAASALLGEVAWPLVAASPLQRARRTAELAVGRAPDRLVEGLMERDWGELQGRPIPARLDQLGTPEGGEPWRDFVARIVAALNGLLEQVDIPLVVGHAGLPRAIRYLATGRPEGPRTANATPLWIAPAAGDQWEIRDFTAADRARLGG